MDLLREREKNLEVLEQQVKTIKSGTMKSAGHGGAGEQNADLLLPGLEHKISELEIEIAEMKRRAARAE
jgi:hypothetical protein